MASRKYISTLFQPGGLIISSRSSSVHGHSSSVKTHHSSVKIRHSSSVKIHHSSIKIRHSSSKIHSSFFTGKICSSRKVSFITSQVSLITSQVSFITSQVLSNGGQAAAFSLIFSITSFVVGGHAGHIIISIYYGGKFSRNLISG